MPQLPEGQAVSQERARIIKIEPSSYLLNVVVKPAQTQTRIRSQLPVTVRVTDQRGGQPVSGARLTIAVVDEGLLALRPNTSWNLASAMLRDRPALVDGYWLERYLTPRLPVGPHPSHLPPEEARAQQMSAPKGMAAPAPALAAAPSGAAARRSADAEMRATPSVGGSQPSPRSDFSSLLMWQTSVTTDANGQATVIVPSNDSLSRFRIVAIGTDGAAKFGEGTATFETTQALQVISGLPQQVRADDRLVQSLTLRNTSTEAITVQLSAKAEILPAPRLALSADTRKAR